MLIRSILFRTILTIILAQVLACDNLLDSVSTKDTPEALIFATQLAIDQKKWTVAIDTIGTMDTTTQATEDVIKLKASAFAGRCGFEYVPWIQGLATIATDKLFFFLMKQFTGVTQTEMDDCIAADLAWLSITTDATLRSTGDNLVFAFVSLAKIGAILSFHADPDADNIATSTFDGCSTTDLPDDYAKHVTTGFANALNALTASASSTIGGGLTGDLGTVCTALELAGPTFNFCAISEIADVTTDQLRAMRTLIYEPDAVGLATCPDGSPSFITCLCP